MAEARRMVRGKSDRLRIGYVASAMHEYLEPALALLRRTYPKLKIKMLDQTPGEMIIELRRGEIRQTPLEFSHWNATAGDDDNIVERGHESSSREGFARFIIDVGRTE